MEEYSVGGISFYEKSSSMRSLKFIFLFFTHFTFGLISYTQCNYTPTITGDLLICPNDTAVLSTQYFDTYQWYSRPYGQPSATPIAGAIFQQLEDLDYYNNVGVYFSVEVSLNGCPAVMSQEILLDGWAFSGLTVMSEDYDSVDTWTGELYICAQDSIKMTLNLPYNSGIIWYLDGSVIANSNSSIYYASQPGDYTVSGAPIQCPDFVQYLTIPIEVVNYGTPPVVVSQSNILGVLNSSLYQSFQWYDMNGLIIGETDSTFNVTEVGYYRVEVIDFNGCIMTSEFFDYATNVNYLTDINSSLEYYPNPSKEKIFLKGTSKQLNLKANVYDLQGRIVLSSYAEEIDLSNLDQGSYLISVIDERGCILLSQIIQKSH